MAISLEELKRQRGQIQKHLDWLDAKIREQEPGGGSPRVIADAIETAHPEPEPTKTPAEDTDGSEESTKTEEVTRPKVELEGQVYQSKTQDELLRAKLGCILFFIFGIALFLFLLFGLPYFL